MNEGDKAEYRLLGNLIIHGRIVCETGLMIGGTDEMSEIGGVDKQVVKDINGLPYIPGSSIKGKMRSLLEWQYKKVNPRGVHACESTSDALKCPICRVFGVRADQKIEVGPTRLICRDAHPTESTRQQLRRLETLEIKTENAIDRLTSKANPRTFERVPKGSEFETELIYTLLEMNGDAETDKRNLETVFLGIRLLQDSALGGSGSRGYGKIRFDGMECIWRSVEHYRQGKAEERCALDIDKVREIIG